MEDDLLRCPLCSTDGVLIPFTDPIEYWCCKKCKTVVVRDKDGCISLLDINVRYEER